MSRRYHCDYCDKSFFDNPTNRRNHLRGVGHSQNVKMHYDQFKDAAQQLALDSQKRPCHSFFNTGSCGYGDVCRYSHMTEEIRQGLHQEAKNNSLRSGRGKRANQIRRTESEIAAYIADLLQKKSPTMDPSNLITPSTARQSSDLSVVKDTVVEEQYKQQMRLPAIFQCWHVNDLPVSLLPGPLTDTVDQWG